jgi:hypothetical protein|tara:strand:+ start:237 stop:479 length:243 start_codon:yes stop_codon:yes gene_type:complete
MNNILQYKNNSLLSQLFSRLSQFYRFETQTLGDKIVEAIAKAAVTFLVAIFVVGWSTLVFELVTDPSQFSNTSFGIFDYI